MTFWDLFLAMACYHFFVFYFLFLQILDGIQVSIRNVHVLYRDVQNDLVRVTLIF